MYLFCFYSFASLHSVFCVEHTRGIVAQLYDDITTTTPPPLRRPMYLDLVLDHDGGDDDGDDDGVDGVWDY